MKQRLKKVIIISAVLAAFCAAAVFGLDFYIKNSVSGRIITAEEAEELSGIDCAVVLGAGVRNGKPTPMLRDRILTGISLYESGAVPKVIMSGDHGSDDYDEVNVMKNFAMDKGIPDEDIFMDHAGFSTYETLYRAKEVFEADKVIIVTQKYHLYRALYIAEKLGIEAYGVPADQEDYAGQLKRDAREILARIKDFATCIIKPEPTYLGDKIPVSGSGSLTND